MFELYIELGLEVFLDLPDLALLYFILSKIFAGDPGCIDKYINYFDIATSEESIFCQTCLMTECLPNDVSEL